MDMRIICGTELPAGADLIGAVHGLYLEACREGRTDKSAGSAQTPLSLIPVDRETAAGWFCAPGRITYTLWDGSRAVGMASGMTDAGRRCGYLSFAYILPQYRNRGLGTRLLDAWEADVSASPDADKLEAAFYCPVHLPWYVPRQDTDDARQLDWHPCVPGVDVASGLYRMLQNRGFRDYAIQNAYHQRLAGYTDPPALARTRERLLSEGIELTMYDETRHRGLAELFDNIRNPGWKAQVMAHTDRPIVVAVDHNADELVVSYTGPLSVDGKRDGQPGRGNFCGIGTRTEYRGRGIGKLVFCEMCRRHAAAGADFMTLYTGDNNPARNIYEAAGFRITRTFACMRKELKASPHNARLTP